jgi:hypothetical protein
MKGKILAQHVAHMWILVLRISEQKKILGELDVDIDVI